MDDKKTAKVPYVPWDYQHDENITPALRSALEKIDAEGKREMEQIRRRKIVREAHGEAAGR